MTIKYVRGSDPHEPFEQTKLAGYDLKRGKILPGAQANAGTPKDGDGRGHDPESGRAVLDEALRD